MRTIRENLTSLWAILAIGLGTLAAPACNVPVFRYALERWEADPYEAILFERGPLNPDQQAGLDALSKAAQSARANLTITIVDLNAEVRPALRTLWSGQINPTPPWLVLRYPRHAGIESPAWAGPLETGTAKQLLDSPVRRDISERLLRGDAVVWLMLEPGKAGADREHAQLLETKLRALEKTLELPKLTAADPQLKRDLPLKIAFSTVHVARSDPAERVLVNLLLSRNTNWVQTSETMLFPIFGRGRVIPPAVGDQIQDEAIQEMAEFLTGPCSCEVKEQNPGFDMLLTADWNSVPSYQEFAVPDPPPLVGMSQFAADAGKPGSTSGAPASASVSPPKPATAAPSSRSMTRNLVIALAVAAVGLVLATVVFTSRRR